MRVLHVCSSLDARFGGPAVALVGIARAQQHAGMDVRVTTTILATESSDGVETLRRDGVEVQTIGPAKLPLRTHPQIDSTLERMIADADIIHIHALWEQIQHRAARAARKLRKPYIFRPCGMLDPWSLSQSRLKKILYMALRLRRDLNQAAAIHYTSNSEAQDSAGVKLRSPPVIEPLGVNLEEFETLPPPDEFRGKYPRLNGRKVIAFLGRVHPGKGVELLVPALARLKDRDAMLLVIGPNSENHLSTVQKQVDDLGLRERVIFTGMLKGPSRIAAMVCADLFCLPSEHENFGIAVVEALAAGLPAIVTHGVAIHSDIASAGVGSVVERNPDALAAELDRWLAEDSLRHAAAARARPFVWRQYNWSEIAKRWRGHYEIIRSRY